MLINPERSQLLMVDVQERLLPAMSAPEALVAQGAILLAAAAELGLPATVSEQYPKGLGPTIPELAPPPGAQVIAKTAFSCLSDPALAARLRSVERGQLVVFGIEAHVCVLQTALEAVAAGFETFVVADATASRRPESKERGLARMAAEGVRVVTAEMAVFEWLQTASAPAFRSLSRLIR